MKRLILLRFFAALVSMSLALSLTACGGQSEPQQHGGSVFQWKGQCV